MSFQPPILYTNIEYLLPDNNNFDNNNTNNNMSDNNNNRNNTTLALGAGCYWGTEKFIVRDFQKRFPNSIETAKVGFMNPNPKSRKTNPPTYREVCSGITGYLEVLDITLSEEFASNPTNLEELFRFFYMFHDPTTKNRQGNDVGTQYASAIFFTTPQQHEIALKVQTELQQAIDSPDSKFTSNYQKNVIETKITAYTEFVEAHEEHQRYLEKNPSGYCNHYYRFRTWPEVEVLVEDTGASGKEEDDAPKQETTNTEQKKKGSWSQKVMKSLTKKVVPIINKKTTKV